MISFRQILIITLVAVGVWLFQRWRRRLARRRPPAPLFQPTVRCACCGVHLPRASAVGDDKAGYFCSEAHRLEYLSRRD